MLGQEGHDRRDHAQPLHERVPERPEGRVVGSVEAAPRAADVPVREVVHEALEGADDPRRPVVLVRRRRLLHEPLDPGQQPAVERLGLRRELAALRLPAFDVGVVDEEADGVPERQQPPLDVLGRPVAELDVLARHDLAEQPAHDVRAHPVEGLVRLDRVAPRPVHLAAVLVEQLLVGEDAAVRRAAGQRHGHERLRVEPEPDLLAHLGDPVGREPRLPVRVVGEIGPREPCRGSGGVAARDPLRALPPERREGNDPGVEPGVPDLGNAPDLAVALLAPHRHLVDPGTVELPEALEPGDRALLELRARPDHVHVAALALVERKRQPEVALPGDVPVPHVV